MDTHGRRDHHAKLGQRTEPRPIATAPRLKVRLDHPGMQRVGRDALVLVSVVERFGSDDAGLLAVAVAFPGLWSAAVPLPLVLEEERLTKVQNCQTSLTCWGRCS